MWNEIEVEGKTFIFMKSLLEMDGVSYEHQIQVLDDGTFELACEDAIGHDYEVELIDLDEAKTLCEKFEIEQAETLIAVEEDLASIGEL